MRFALHLASLLVASGLVAPGLVAPGLVASGLLPGALSPASAATLRSPWDGQPVKSRPGDYACPLPPPLPKDIVAADFYSDSKHSVIDPARQRAYEQAEAPFRAIMDQATKAADKFQATGNRGAADCVEHLLLLEANADAMTGTMSTNQANYVQNWTLGSLAVSWLKVRPAQPGSAAERATIAAWMVRVAGDVRSWFDARVSKNTVDSRNNHFYWAGMAVCAAGIAGDDRSLFDWGIGTYDKGVAQIEPDGTLPLEMARGQRALHYHVFAAAPLVLLAEFGAANQLDLYSRDHNALQRLVDRVFAGIADNRFFNAKAGVEQVKGDDGKPKKENLTWATPFLRRFPNATESQILRSSPPKPDGYLGGLPPA